MPKGTERIRYAIYTRQSNQGLFDFSSCDAQFRTCQEYARQSGDRLRFRFPPSRCAA